MAREEHVKAIVAAMGVTGCFAMPAWAWAESELPVENPSQSVSEYRDAMLAFFVADHHWRMLYEGAVLGSVVNPDEPAFGPPSSIRKLLFGIDSSDAARTRHWLYMGGYHLSALTLGYAWSKLMLEGSAFSSREQDNPDASRKEPFKLDSSSARFSYRPGPGWSFQLSRGSLSGLDQLNPGGDVQRTSVSATYRLGFREGSWQTTLAWGRNSYASREASIGYLLESALRVGGVHALFGRLEQVRSDELMRQDDALRRELFKLRKLTIGYYRTVDPTGAAKLDIGAFASRYFVPAFAALSYGSEPTAYTLFVRIKFQ